MGLPLVSEGGSILERVMEVLVDVTKEGLEGAYGRDAAAILT